MSGALRRAMDWSQSIAGTQSMIFFFLWSLTNQHPSYGEHGTSGIETRSKESDDGARRTLERELSPPVAAGLKRWNSPNHPSPRGQHKAAQVRISTAPKGGSKGDKMTERTRKRDRYCRPIGLSRQPPRTLAGRERALGKKGSPTLHRHENTFSLTHSLIHSPHPQSPSIKSARPFCWTTGVSRYTSYRDL
ncbi:conserved hypothetical protein [Coccidioides posadasii str. Silveira]|uniref:Uncharacterized protein n=1 Tax=Coccidioides posadasii (strain RMSCC 757 / Silveira) TaxID=443226 RepID=E9D254_COCPS|nr:conserved hypothetical protein [Coccidioides posadasii str. Silveira]